VKIGKIERGPNMYANKLEFRYRMLLLFAFLFSIVVGDCMVSEKTYNIYKLLMYGIGWAVFYVICRIVDRERQHFKKTKNIKRYNRFLLPLCNLLGIPNQQSHPYHIDHYNEWLAVNRAI
jgi:hypothetical protein